MLMVSGSRGSSCCKELVTLVSVRVAMKEVVFKILYFIAPATKGDYLRDY